MFLTKNIQEYICFSEAKLSDALIKINDNQARVVFIVTEHGKLLGSLSDGDVRRWLTKSNKIDLAVPVKEIMNTSVKAVDFKTDKSEIETLFINGVDCIPLVDSANHLIQLAFEKQDGFFVGDREISESSASFIIAEIGNNHQGDIKLAKELVDHAVAAKVDCVKFQMRSMKQLYKSEGKKR
ncbi:CBS domain-containing protein [Pseudoalteromonas sp. H100]|nr:CBS domain-containing protein [Pseudoalteromonas sp. H100]WFO19454.1 CBS domain-containing protein [Pseudoalteromonas sp. H100]